MARRGKRNKRGGASANALAPKAYAGVTEGVPPLANGANPLSGKRTVDIKIVAPSSTWSGRLENRDEVLRQFGGWEGICLYDRMFRQFPTLAGVCNLWADMVNAIDRRIKPGDASIGRSRLMADQTRKQYRKLADLHIINKKMAMGRFFGFATTGKADWRVDEETGLNVPHDLYDIPQKYLKFGPSGEPYMLIEGSSFNGVRIDPSSIFHFRWGSRFTPYGEGDLKFAYLATWYIQQVRQFGMQALEILGRPIPWVEVPDAIVGEEYDKLEAGLAKQYKYYVITRTTSSRGSTTFPSLNVLANGAAGRSELEYIRYLYGEIYILILGVQLTQDKTGGSRALEDSRMDVISDKTPPGSQALDQAWQTGWSDHIWSVNAPQVPRAEWPRFESDTSTSRVEPGALSQVIDIGAKLGTNQMTATFAERSLVSGGIPEEWAKDMVSSTVAERDSLDAIAEPSGFQRQPAAPPPDARLIAIPMEDGTVLHFREGSLTKTLNRGMVPVESITHADLIPAHQRG